ELNVVEQVNNLLKTTIVQKAWSRGQNLHLHGWVFGLNDGIIKPIIDLPSGSEITDIYRYDFE
ncbi:MAG: carbonic anhydrase, partial [Dyadobacter sp.]